jgi:hypothetical protein
MTNNWLEIAKRNHGPDCRVNGNGRWCIYTRYDNIARLYETREEADAQVLDARYVQVTDLAGLMLTGDELLAKIPERYDPDEARRERRESREKRV